MGGWEGGREGGREGGSKGGREGGSLRRYEGGEERKERELGGKGEETREGRRERGCTANTKPRVIKTCCRGGRKGWLVLLLH